MRPTPPERAKVAAWQARTPGDAAIVTSNGSMYRMGGLGGSAKRRDELAGHVRAPCGPPSPARVAPKRPAPSPPPPMLLTDALRASSPDQFVLGYNPELARPAVWSPPSI